MGEAASCWRLQPSHQRTVCTLAACLPPHTSREGERFEVGRHASGTEVKAITYSAMQINEAPGDAEVFVIVDI